MKTWIILGLVAALLCSCGGPQRFGYQITGTTDSVLITFTNARGATQQRTIRPPYTETFDWRTGQVLSITVQNKRNAGVVSCAILRDGKVVQTATADTAFGTATCSDEW